MIKMMNWNQLISAKRFGMEEFHEERQENRSEFQRDYDRLIGNHNLVIIKRIFTS